jgi:hypothetical protein
MAKLLLSGDDTQDGCATSSHRTRLTQAGLILVLAIVFLFVGNVVIESGVAGTLWGIPASAVFVGNYNDAMKYARWDAFITKYTFLDPKLAGVSGGSVSITLPNVQNQLLYGNNVAILEPTISSRSDSAFYKILLPFVLILVLDAQDNTRGKLLSPIQVSENVTQLSPTSPWSVELSSSRFWFRFPPEMRGTRYTVIVELFGYWLLAFPGGTYNGGALQFIGDTYYGMLPQYAQQVNAAPLLAFTRQSFEAPAPQINFLTALGYASIASIFIGAVAPVLWDRRRRINDLLRNNAAAILFFWVSVILFVVMVILIVVLK